MLWAMMFGSGEERRRYLETTTRSVFALASTISHDALAGSGFMLPRGFERPVDGHIGRAGHQKFFGREARDDFVARFR